MQRAPPNTVKGGGGVGGGPSRHHSCNATVGSLTGAMNSPCGGEFQSPPSTGRACREVGGGGVGGGPSGKIHSDAMQQRTTMSGRGRWGGWAGQIGEFAFEIAYESVTWHNRRSLWKRFARIASSLAVRNPWLRMHFPRVGWNVLPVSEFQTLSAPADAAAARGIALP